MLKVITYGTFDMLHYGHIRLLKRAKALGDFLIVGVTSESFDQMRGKINVRQSIQERIESVKETGIADKIIIEEYEGQKIDDIRRYGVDIFAIGSDWRNKFDYLNEYCRVVYLERTEGISSSQIRTANQKIRMGMVGNFGNEMIKFLKESTYVNGIEIVAWQTDEKTCLSKQLMARAPYIDKFDDLLDRVDAIYLVSRPEKHYEQIKQALQKGKHVLCESPVALGAAEVDELFELARENGCILMESLKTAYALAFTRLQLIVKSGFIGNVVSVDATCTSLAKVHTSYRDQSSFLSWGSFGLLPIFLVLGTEYRQKSLQIKLNTLGNDIFAQGVFIYDGAVATLKVANGVKSEGNLVILGTKGYIFVPAPWWKTEYFEVRYENPMMNKKYFYQLEGEGIRYMILNFLRSVLRGKSDFYIPRRVTREIANVMGDFCARKDTVIL